MMMEMTTRVLVGSIISVLFEFLWVLKRKRVVQVNWMDIVDESKNLFGQHYGTHEMASEVKGILYYRVHRMNCTIVKERLFASYHNVHLGPPASIKQSKQQEHRS